MNDTNWLTPAQERNRGDALRAYRHRVMCQLGVVADLFLLPFTVNNFIQGRILLGVGLMCVMLILGINAFVIYFKYKPPPIPFGLVVIPVIAAMALSVKEQGFYGALWSYPAVLIFHFASVRRAANVYSVMVLAVVSLFVHHYIGFEVTVRYFVTLTMTIILINVALNIVDDLNDKLARQAIQDPLTGAFNRRHMQFSLDHAIEFSRRTQTPVSLLLIDIDHFKRINDRFGHAAGDKVLKGLVALIANRIRKVDALFRIGGEEFVVLLPDTGEADAAGLAEELRATIACAGLLQAWPVTVSIGVCELLPDESQDIWLKKADDALYHAKNTGRDRVVCSAGMAAASGRPPGSLHGARFS